jgi:hypothetical protein
MTDDGDQHGPETEPQARRLDSAYEEAVSLTSCLRDYVAANGSGAGAELSAAERCKVSRATSHLTARLLEMVSWLATQKALSGGEISAAEAASAGCQVAPWDEEWTAASGDEDDDLSPDLAPDLAEIVVQGRELHHRVRELGA